jgi:hypothetical protein
MGCSVFIPNAMALPDAKFGRAVVGATRFLEELAARFLSRGRQRWGFGKMAAT